MRLIFGNKTSQDLIEAYQEAMRVSRNHLLNSLEKRAEVLTLRREAVQESVVALENELAVLSKEQQEVYEFFNSSFGEL